MFAGYNAVTVAGRKVDDHPVTTTAVVSDAEIARVQVLFVAGDDPKAILHALSVVAGRPVLTVGESPAFAKAGGMVTFDVVDEKIRFALAMSAATAAGLKVSGHLARRRLRKRSSCTCSAMSPSSAS